MGAGSFGAGDCASEILGVRQSSIVNAISGKHCFHQHNFYFMQHHFIEKIYLIRIFYIAPSSISVKEGLFSPKQLTFRNNSLHPNQWQIQLPPKLHCDFFINPDSTSSLLKRPAPKQPAPESQVGYTISQ